MKDIRTGTSSGSRSNRVPIIRSADGERRYRTRDREIEEKVIAYERGDTDRDGNDTLQKYRSKPIKRQKKSWKFEIYGFLILLVAGALVYAFTFVLNSATVNIKERSENISQGGLIDLNNNVNEKQFELYSITEKDITQIKKSNSIDVKSKAKGYVTIYNNFDKNPQKLVKNTRLETAEGKIFRIDSTVTVPGKTDQGAGSVKVLAIADTYGGEYNIEATTFTIPGFKGSPKYQSFNAKSENSMSGGDVGKRYLIGEQDLKDAEAKIVPGLVAKLKDKIKQYNDENYTVVANSITFKYENNRAKIEQEQNINNLEEKVTASIIIVPKTTIAKVLAKLNLSMYNGIDEVKLRNYDVLHLSVASNSNAMNASNTVEVYAEYRGDIIWSVDIENIRKQLVGKNISDFPTIMSSFVGVDTATPTFHPMWVHSFPNTSKRITVILE